MKPFNGRLNGTVSGNRIIEPSRRSREIVANPNDLIDTIVDAIDYAETARDSQGLIKARRLLNNDLRQAIDVYIKDEVTRALGRGHRTGREA